MSLGSISRVQLCGIQAQKRGTFELSKFVSRIARGVREISLSLCH